LAPADVRTPGYTEGAWRSQVDRTWMDVRRFRESPIYARRGEAITFTVLALVDTAKEVKLVDGTSRLILLGANRP
jgi:hypothetical protein